MPQADNVTVIADGRTREDIERRAELAFTRANELRATADWITAAAATIRATAWVRVLRHLDRTGAGTFDRAAFDDRGGSYVGVFGLGRGLALHFGRKPFTFYTAPARHGEAAR